MKKLSKFTALALLTAISLTACANKGDSGKKKEEEKKKVGVQDKLVIENEGTPVSDATLKVAYVSPSPFTGIFHQAFADGNPDMEIMNFAMNGTFLTDGEFKVRNGGGADVEFKPEEKKVVVTINDKYTWNDGVPVTSKDFLEYYKVIADKDYEGGRINKNMKNLVGL